MLCKVSGLAAGLLLAAVAQAAPVTYTIDSSTSSLTLANSSLGGTGTPQKAGADVTKYSGTIIADLTGSTLTFSGGSTITASANPNAPFNPTIGSDPAIKGTVDNYGMQVFIPSYQINADQAFRDLVLDISGGSASINGPANSLSFTIAKGISDGKLGATLASGDLAGKAGTNGASGNVTLSGSGALVIPVNVTINIGSSTQPGSMTLTGTLYAQAVPEPASLSMLGLGAAGLLLRRRKSPDVCS